MASINLKNFNKHFSDETKLWAAKCQVRECDEESPGHFMAFVDQGKESFDVSISLAKSGEISKLTCDCKKGDLLCQHKYALLIHITSSEKVKTPKIIKRKLSEIDLLFEEVGVSDLQQWLKEVFDKDKSLKLEFIQRFKKYEVKILNRVEITKELGVILRTVVGRKKTIEPSELKKTVNLWSGYLHPLFTLYFNNPSDEALYRMFQDIIYSLNQMINEIWVRSDASYTSYTKKLFISAAKSISEISDDFEFKSTVTILLKDMFNSQGFIINVFEILNELKKYINENRKEWILENFVPKYEEYHSLGGFGDGQLTRFLYELADETNSLEKLVDKILPILYQTTFNERIIRILLDNNHYERAITHCSSLTNKNFQSESNFIYLNFLKEAYTKTGDKSKLIKVKEETLPYTIDFNDFLDVYENISDHNSKILFKSQVLAKFRGLFQYARNIKMAEISINIQAHSNNYGKLIEYLQDYPTISLFLPHLDKMLTLNKIKTLKNILSYFGKEIIYHNFDKKNDTETFPECLQILQNYFPTYELEIYLNEKLNDKFTQIQKGTFLDFLRIKLI